jgi:hypothetical protein
LSPAVEPGAGRRSRRSEEAETETAAEPQPPAPEQETEFEEDSDASAMTPAALAESLGREILHQVEVRPYTTVLVAAATGYVLGVGTPTWVTKLAWSVASRLAVSKIVASLE